MSILYDAPAYNRRACPIPPRAVDATGAVSADAAVLRSQLDYAMRALRHTRATLAETLRFAGVSPDMIASKTALADSALEQFGGQS